MHKQRKAYNISHKENLVRKSAEPTIIINSDRIANRNATQAPPVCDTDMTCKALSNLIDIRLNTFIVASKYNAVWKYEHV